MTIKPSVYVTVRFRCMHMREMKRKESDIGTVKWCMRCHQETEIEKVIEQYRLKCMSCRFGRLAGTRRASGGYVGTKHWGKNPTHTLHMYLGMDLVRVWQPQAEEIFTKTLLSDGITEVDVPPF